MIEVLMPLVELADDVVLGSELLEPVVVAALADPPVVEEEVTPVAGDPANELPGALLDFAPQPIRERAVANSNAVVPTNAVRRRSPRTPAENANSKTAGAASNKMTLTRTPHGKRVGKLATL